MDRKAEILIILKSLLGQTITAIDDNQYSSDHYSIVKSSKKVADIGDQIYKYINELENL